MTKRGAPAGPQALAWLEPVPAAAVAALLAYAGWQLADVSRLAFARRSCLPIIALAVATSLLVNFAAGLLIGVAAELLRSRLAAACQRS